MTLRFADLHEIASSDGAPFGGKARGLARLIAAGADVPPGFAVEASATAPDRWSPGAREEFLSRAKRLLAQAPIAVRSSALCEDGESRSFAGLFETVLGIADSDAALAAAARCIASGATTRVTEYAGAHSPLPVGLVCQIQVPARAAGVCFTVDPSGRDEAIVVEAVAGAGDALVSGKAQPERWRVYRSGFGTWEPRRDGTPAPILTGEEAVDIARCGAELASRFGARLDLEWARDQEDRLWWLQARPITRAREPRRWQVDRSFEGDDGPVTVWANWNIRETMPDPLSPLSWSIWRDVILGLLVRSLLDLPSSSPLYRHLAVLDRVQGRVYWNMNTLISMPGFGLLATSTLRFVDADAARVFSRLLADRVVRSRRIPGSRAGIFLSIVAAQVKGLKAMGVALSPGRMMRLLANFGEKLKRRQRPLDSLSDTELIAEIRHLDGPEAGTFSGVMNVMGMSMGIYQAACYAFRHSPDAVRLMTSGLTGNPTTRISIGLDALVERARPIAWMFEEPLAPQERLSRLTQDPRGREWVEAFRTFIALYGQRCPKEFDLSSPRWAEDPAMLLDLIRTGLRSTGESVTARLSRLAAQRRGAIDEAVARAPFWKRPLMRWLARRVVLHMPLREAPKHYLMIAFLRMRLAAVELGRRLAKRGVLSAQDDVFLLELSELERMAWGEAPPADLARILDGRRSDLARFEREPAPSFVRSDGVPVEDLAPPDDRDGALRGTPVSGGRVTGLARILLTPDVSAIRQGDVLVVAFADPGWTPLFPRVAALVMEVGGLMCHAAVVAREIGVPSVFGVRDATTRIRDGQMITVDGDRGTVTLE